jgi:hypothetical protein
LSDFILNWYESSLTFIFAPLFSADLWVIINAVKPLGMPAKNYCQIYTGYYKP